MNKQIRRLALSSLLLLPLSVSSRLVKAESEEGALANLFSLSGASVKNTHKKVSSVFGEDENEYGVEFLSSPNGGLTYKNVVDLREIDKTDNLIEIVGNSSLDYSDLNKAFVDIFNMHIRVTDAYDSSIYFEVNLTQNPALKQLPISNINGGNNNLFYTVTCNGYTLANNSDYTPLEGYTVAWKQSLFNPSDYLNGEKGSYLPTGFKFDLETNQVLLDIGAANSASTLDPHNHLLFDLDDPTDAYPDFAGFTTGEVYITIASEQTGSFMVSKIGNDAFSSFDASLFGKNTGNLLTYQYDFDRMIEGAKGHYYPLPQVLSNGSYTMALNNGGENVPLDDPSNFIPSEAGEYSLYLSSKNAFGKVVSKEGKFRVNEEITPLKDNSGVTEIKATLFSPFLVPFFSYDGGNGEHTKLVQIVLDNDIYESEEGDSFVIERKCASAFIRVTLVDEIRVETSFSYPIDLDTNVRIFRLTDAYETNYVSIGDDFRVPSYTAIDYSKDDVTKTNMDIDIRRGRGNYYQAGDLISDVKNDFVLDYCFGEEILMSVRVIAIRSNLSSQDDDFNDYYKDNENVIGTSISAAGIRFSLEAGEALIKQPSIVSTTDLTVSFSYFPELADYHECDIVFTAIGGKQIVVSLRELSDKPLLYLNGKRIYKSVSVSEQTYSEQDGTYLYGKKYYKYTFVLSGEKKKITSASNQTIADLSTFNDGSNFTGFSRAAAQISFLVRGAKKGNAFFLNQISNQQLTSQVLSYGDSRAPYIAFDQPFSSGIYKRGDTVSLPNAYAYDVFTSAVSISMNVSSPLGDYIIKNANPSALSLPLASVGVYYVSYTCTDGNGQTATYGYRLVVADDVAPTIYSNAAYFDSYVGEFYVYKASAYDEVDGIVDVIAILRGPDGNSYVVKMGEKASLPLKGTYILTYYAIDESGNVAMLSYSFVSK